MSSSCRSQRRLPHFLGTACVIAGTISVDALAADSYFVPSVTARADHDSNRSLVPRGQPSDGITGYTGTIGAILGMRTPRSETDIRPQLSLSRYPDAKEFDQTEGAFDFRTTYRSPRSTLGLTARYSRTSEYNAEFVDIGFDDFDPEIRPVAGTGTGRVVASEVRERINVRPKFQYQLSPRTAIGVNLSFQDVSYDADGPVSQRDYQDWDAEMLLSRTLSPKTTLSVGGFANRYETDDKVTKSDGYGLSAGLRQRWSETLSADVALRLEESTEKTAVELPDPVTLKDKSTQWSAQAGLAWRGEVTRLRVSAGRTLTPSGGGSRSVRDEIRAQFDRELSARWVWHAALRALDQDSQSELRPNDKRKSARFETSLDWRASPTWTIRAGAAYTWQDRKEDPSSAHNESVFLSLGYRGLGPAGR